MNEMGQGGEAPVEAPKRGRRWPKAFGVGVLSLLVPGAGQLVNRQPRKALAIGVAAYLLRFAQAHTHWMLAFGTLVGMVVVGLVFLLAIVADSVYNAAAGKNAEAAIPAAKVSYPAIAILLLLGVIFPGTDQVIRDSGFGAFRVDSGSMCPAVCKGERIVADRNAYRKTEPQRGDVILVKRDTTKAPFLKRVIGLPGDVIRQESDGTVVVNGAAFHPPEPCGKPEWKGPTPPTCPMCTDVTVKPGEYFVVGDDLGNSFDSRYKEFGAVTKEMLVGKVLFISWSGSRSRIGCTVR